MKKWLIILLIVLASIVVALGVVFACMQIFGFKGQKVEDLDRTQETEQQIVVGNEKTITNCTPQESLYILAGKIKQLNYEATLSGQVSALGGLYKQTVTGSKYNTSQKSLYISKATSSFVNVGKQIFITQNNVKVLEAKDVKKDTWEESAISYSLDDYLIEYGVDFRELSNYTLNDSTITSAKLVSNENGVYVYEYTLDINTATIGYRLNMTKMGNLVSLPQFSSCKLTVALNENFEPQYITSEDEYMVEMLGGLKCKSVLTVTFDKINQEIVFPDLSKFEQQN